MNKLSRVSPNSKLAGNHHLKAIVVGLIAILGALSIYFYIYQHRQSKNTQTLPPETVQVTGNNQTSDTPINRTSLVGTVKEVQDERLRVATLVTSNGKTVERLINIQITSSTTITKAGATTIGLPTQGNETKTHTPATVHDVRVGSSVEVTAADTIDTATSITATTIDILTSPSAT